MRRFLLMLGLLAGLCFSSFTTQAETKNHVMLADANPSSSPEVTVFFWYGCKACQQLSASLNAFQQRHPQLAIRYVPAQLRTNWYWGAKAFYSAQRLPHSNTLHQALYQANWQQLTTHKQLSDWFIQQGVPAEQVETVIYSPLLNQQLDKDNAQYRYPLKGVPSLIVNNQYLIDASMVSDAQQMLDVVGHLLQQDQIRQEERDLRNVLLQESVASVSDS